MYRGDDDLPSTGRAWVTAAAGAGAGTSNAWSILALMFRRRGWVTGGGCGGRGTAGWTAGAGTAGAAGAAGEWWPALFV